MIKTETVPVTSVDRVIVSGIHLELSSSLRQAAIDKVDHLFRHEETIIRVRIDLELDHTRNANDQFVAKGRVEISGPDLIARVNSEDAYKSLDLLVDKLDELLRRRHQKRVNTRNDERAQVSEQVDLDS